MPSSAMVFKYGDSPTNMKNSLIIFIFILYKYKTLCYVEVNQKKVNGMSKESLFEFDAKTLDGLTEIIFNYADANLKAEKERALLLYRQMLILKGKRFMGFFIRHYNVEEIMKMVKKAEENPHAAFPSVEYRKDYSPYWRAKDLKETVKWWFSDLSTASKLSFKKSYKSSVYLTERDASRLSQFYVNDEMSDRFKEWILNDKINLDLDAEY